MKLKQKLMASVLTLTMMGTYLLTLGNAVIAVSDNLVTQNSKTNNSNVEFNSYFEGGEYSKTFEAEQEAKLYFEIKISNTGYLKNGVVQFSNANFEVDTDNLKNDKVQSSTKNEIKLKQINNSSNATIVEVPIVMKNEEVVDSDLFEKVSTVTFTGKYIDENGKEHDVEKEINNQANWKGTAELDLSGSVEKFKLYEINGEKGLLLQSVIKTGIKDNSLPVANTKLEISIPEIKIVNDNEEETNILPERVTVVANTTAGTNGEGSNEFNESNYKYNEETGKIEIEVTNNEKDGKIAWKKDSADEYLVSYMYTGDEVYNYINEQLEKAKETVKTEEQKEAGEVNENAINGEIEVKASVEVYGLEETKIEKTEKINYSIEEQKGEITDTSISSTSSISKGYIYANYEKAAKEAKGQNIEDKKDTEFEVKYTQKIYDKTLTNGVTFETVSEKYVDGDKEEYSSRVNNKETIYSKAVKIEEKVFNKILGTEGKIDITDKEGKVLASITKDTEKDSSGNYIVNIEEAKVNEVVIKTSAPIIEGNITVTVEKAILGNQNYSKEQMESFEKIILGVTAGNSKKAEMKMTEPVSKAEISIDTENLSTVVKNEDVELRVVLNTDNIENALYKNPKLQIVLPENIETIDIKNVDILLDDELKIKESKVEEQNGRKVIVVTLEGTQTKYMDNGTSNKNTNGQNIIAKGANIVIKADITFEKLAPSANTNILLYYTNENSNLYEKTANQSRARNANNSQIMGLASTDINVVSPNGVVTESHMSGYNGTKTISNSETGKVEDIINANDSSKEVTVGGTIVNNYANSIENVSILGRLPFSGNKQIDSDTELGSKFTMKMVEKLTTDGINSDNVKIYYSTNEQATKDLENTENAWTENPSNLDNIKSYLIVINGEVKTGTQFTFEYKVELPENIDYNNGSYTIYKVYYDNKMEDATLGETKVAGIIGLTTGAAPDVSVELQSTIDTVREGQVVKMKAVVKNSGSKTATNVKVNVPLPEKATFMEYSTGNGFVEEEEETKVITIGNLAAGESKTVSYYIKFDNNVLDEVTVDNEGDEGLVTSYPREISHKVKVTADDINGSISSNEYKFSVQEGEITLELFSDIDEDIVLQKGQIINYLIKITNISELEHLTNTVITVQLPQGLSYEKAEIKDLWSSEESTTDGITYNEENNTITFNIGTLDIQKWILLDVKVEEPNDVSIFATAKADETEEHYSNKTEYETENVNLEISELTSTPRYVKEGDNVTYTLTLTNKGNSNITGIDISDKLPEGLEFVKATYTYNGTEQAITNLTNGKVEISINQLVVGESTTIKLIAKAEILPDTNDKQVKNSMTILANNFEETTTNEVTNIIEYSQEVHDQVDDGNTSIAGRYKITGTAWLDENKDGERSSEEQVLANIQVMLINKDNSEIVKDVDTGEQKIVNTNSEGQYEFSNLVVGEYLVVFLYDAGQYDITEYQVDTVDESYNSDAINMKVVLDGEQRYAGVTDTIKITDSNARDIDIGLYIAEKFDLRLDKYISKITLTTPTSGTKVYYYDNSKLTKQEIYSKDVNNSSLVVEYKIVVTNEGQIAGYAKKIIDYLPEDVVFNSELNQDWYISDNNGVVYNTALANEKIEPGQSKEITLILSLNITDKNIGTVVNNNAEIYESYNDQGLQDYDSQEANMLETEDDMSSADIMLSLSTGRIILYTTLTLAILVILSVGIFEIKKHVLDKKNN